ncbi:MAG: hypothetical protein LH473_00875 [Chitinophagales bacterium]|nr:hypothetical protein [Chitinophagales bacterium]
MENSNNNYQLLIRKLDEFIRKFYVNQLIRGAIYTGAILLAAFLVISVSEYYFYFSSSIRTILFFGFLAGALFVLVRWVIIPAMHYFNLGKTISHEKAASIIGSHFANVQDRLLNILQLKNLANENSDSSLIEASINQKIEAIKPVPFSSAINLSVNRKYLRYLLAPILVLAFILFASPNLLKDSTLRLIHHNEYFEKKSPFQFNVVNEKLQTIQYSDYEVKIKVSGEALPNEAFIEMNGFQYPLTKKSATEYSYNIVKPQKDVSFFISANGFRSKDFDLKVLPKPIIEKFSTALTYPSYTGRKNETLQNIGDLTVPEGTKINWQFLSQNTSEILIRFGDSTYTMPINASEEFNFTKRVKNDVPYTVFISGNDLPKADSIGYSISVIPDRYPAISVSQVSDSNNKKYLYLAGEASDDYGLRNVYFKYKIEKAGEEISSNENYESIAVQFTPGKYSQFSHYWDLNTVGLNPGDNITYFFEAWDNDGVNGSKFSRSQVMTFAKPTEKEMEKQTYQESEKIKDDLESSMKEAQQLRDEFEKLQNELLNKKNPTWEDKKKIEDLLKRQQELNNKIEGVKKSLKENQQNQNENKPFNEETKQKSEELQKLMDQTLTPEMKEMMKKLQDMLDELNKDKTLDQLQDQKLNNDQLQKELDRMLALYKQLEFEKKMNDTKDKLDNLAKKQNDLANKTADDSKKLNSEEKKNKADSLGKKQEELQNEFKDVQEDLKDLEKKNQELDHPNEMPETKEEQQQTEQQQQDAKENLEKQNNKKASESQKNASQQMQKMSEKMSQAMQSMQQQQDEIDMQAVRQILENLIKISFDQEDLISKTKGVNVYNPMYLEIMKSQKDVKDDLQMVKDSIQELSKRVTQIKNFVNEQITSIDKNMENALHSLEQRQTPVAASNQQYIMTGVNNLALIFNEVMKQMQEQMSQQMAGSQMCQKPGGKKQSMSSMKQMQKQLNDKIQQMGQQMKDGKTPKDGKGTGQQMSQQMAQMAQQQAQIRESIRQMNDELNKDGKNSMGNLDKLQKDMEKTETELLNKQITAEMIKRQQEIMTKLLEAENAERQRETDNKRESETGKEMVKKLPPEIEEYLKKKQGELELYKTVPPDLKPFYRDLVEEYYKSLQQ